MGVSHMSCKSMDTCIHIYTMQAFEIKIKMTCVKWAEPACRGRRRFFSLTPDNQTLITN